MPKARTNQELVSELCADPVMIGKLAYITNVDLFVWFDEQKSFYQILDKRSLSKRIYMWLVEKVEKNITMSLVEDIIRQIKLMFPRVFEDIISPFIGLSDFKMYNVDTEEIISASINTPCFHYVNLSSTDIKKGYEDTPLFNAFLNDILVDKQGQTDEKLKLLMQEIFGYVLLPTLEAHASFFFVGGGSNGKSVMLNIIRKMIGEYFCDSKTIETLTTSEFAAADLVGKRLNICSEEESKFIKSDKFKAIVAADPVSVRRIYEATFVWIPTVKYIFSTNAMPTFSGFNKGLLRRIFLLPFNREISDMEKDTNLFNKLKKEINGITLWALAGAKRLKENNYHFTDVEQVNTSKEKFKEELSSAALFFNENYTLSDMGNFISKDNLYEIYVAWCQKRGKKQLHFYNFFNDLEIAQSIKFIKFQNELGIKCIVNTNN